MNPNQSLSPNSHCAKPSYESIYSSEGIQSFSLSSSSVPDSDASVNIDKVNSKTQEMKEIVTNRLTAFLYMSQRWVEDNKAKDEVIEFRKSVDKTLSVCLESEEKGEEFVRKVLGQIAELQKEYERLEKRLCETRIEIRDTEEEEEKLKRQMEIVEQNVGKFIFGTNEKVSAVCECMTI